MDTTDIIGALGQWSVGAGPLYKRLADGVERALVDGTLGTDTRLPAERTLADALAVSRSTVIAAYDLLRQDGYAHSRRGSGTWLQAPSNMPTRPHREARTSTVGSFLQQSAAAIDLSTGAPHSLSESVRDAVGARAVSFADVFDEPGYAPLGLPRLRQAIAQTYIAVGLPTQQQHILVTTGAQQALGLIAALYVGRGDTVISDNPTYFGVLDIFRSLGARVIGVPVTEHGLSIGQLRRAVQTYMPRLVYIMPTHNPTGIVLSADQRQAITRIVGEYATPLVEDNTLAYLGLDAQSEPLPPIAVYAPTAPIISVGSMSKLFWAGLRVGWVRAPEGIIQQLARLKAVTDLGSGLLDQAYAAHVLQHLSIVQQARQRELLSRLDVFSSLLTEHLPELQWQRPKGGFCVWVRLPSGNAHAFAQVALREGVIVLPGATLSVDNSCDAYVRLSFLLPPGLLAEGVARLKRAWLTYVSVTDRSDIAVPIVV